MNMPEKNMKVVNIWMYYAKSLVKFRDSTPNSSTQILVGIKPNMVRYKNGFTELSEPQQQCVEIQSEIIKAMLY